MDYQTIRTEISAGVFTISLARPEAMNALCRVMRSEITHALLQPPDRARAIVLTGEGKAFCSGQDLIDVGNLEDFDVEATLRREYEPMLRAIYDCPLPTLAAVNGVAAGAGANLALACDVVVAAESASFIQAFTRIGLMPDAGGTYWLPRQVGFARAMGAMLFAEAVSACEAAEWGMIWEAVPDEDFGAHCRMRAEALAKGPTQAYRHLKAALRRSFDNDVETQLEDEARRQAACGVTADFVEGVAAFREKRQPEFRGS